MFWLYPNYRRNDTSLGFFNLTKLMTKMELLRVERVNAYRNEIRGRLNENDFKQLLQRDMEKLS